MSSLLYRLGRWCAAHAWRTLTIWLVLLVGLGALAGTVGKPLTSQISIPGTTFQKVIDGLGTEIPEAAGGAGTVVLESTDGTPITDEQRAAAEEVFATWAQVPHVKRVNNPFEAQAQLDKSATDLTAAAAKVDDGQKQLDAGRAQLARGPVPARRGRGAARAARGEQPERPEPARAPRTGASPAVRSWRRPRPSSSRPRPTSPPGAPSTRTARPSPPPPRAPAW